MSIISIHKNLNAAICRSIEHTPLFSQSEIDIFCEKNKFFHLIYDTAYKILEKNSFVVLRNMGFCRDKRFFESFIKLFGDFYGSIEYTGITTDCFYTGCDYSQLVLHTDDAIDINAPKYTFIQVLKEDPNGDYFGWNGIVRINDVFEYLSIYEKSLLDTLLSYTFPMLSVGVSVSSENKEELIMKRPILSIRENLVNVCFDLSRVKYFYFKRNIPMPDNEKEIIQRFLSICHQFRKRYYLSKGDILIIDNHRALHDREETTVELDQDGKLNSREIFVSFAYEKN